MLTKNDLQIIRQAFDAAVKSSPDSIQAGLVLHGIWEKLQQLQKGSGDDSKPE